MGKQIEEERESCPRCGALPCDWCEDPHKPSPDSTVEVGELVEAITNRRRAPPYAHNTAFNAGLDAAVAIVTAHLATPSRPPVEREAVMVIISGAASDAASIWEGCGDGADTDVFERAADAILALIAGPASIRSTDALDGG
jgi:hypothetical protein